MPSGAPGRRDRGEQAPHFLCSSRCRLNYTSQGKLAQIDRPVQWASKAVYVRGGSLPPHTPASTYLPPNFASFLGSCGCSLWGVGYSQELQSRATTGSVSFHPKPHGRCEPHKQERFGELPLLSTPTCFLCLATQVLIFSESRPGVPLRQSLGSVLGSPGNQVVPSSPQKQEKN